jgi:hypothetical protein
VAVYLPPQTDAGTKTALSQLYKEISKQETTHPEVALLVAGDFNAGKLKSVLPNLYQHVKCATRRKKIIDHLYSTHRDAYQALPRPPFGKSDRNSILIPAYKQKLKQEAPVTRSIKKWSDEADAKLQDCFDITDWNMFGNSSNDIEQFTTSVTGFINKCIEDAIHTGNVCTYPNQKPWIIGNIRTELKGRAAAFKVWDSEAYKNSCYALRRTIKQATCQYRAKFGSDNRRMWQGSQTITGYNGKHSRELPSDTGLPDELNHFYARFEASNIEACMRASAVPDDCVITQT